MLLKILVELFGEAIAKNRQRLNCSIGWFFNYCWLLQLQFGASLIFVVAKLKLLPGENLSRVIHPQVAFDLGGLTNTFTTEIKALVMKH